MRSKAKTADEAIMLLITKKPSRNGKDFLAELPSLLFCRNSVNEHAIAAE